VDNKPLLDLFLQRPVGVFAILDEESIFPRATDESLTEKLHKNFKKSKGLYGVPKVGKEVRFNIQHYAGTITYVAALPAVVGLGGRVRLYWSM
jgi:myosin heavy subunit